MRSNAFTTVISNILLKMTAFITLWFQLKHLIINYTHLNVYFDLFSRSAVMTCEADYTGADCNTHVCDNGERYACTCLQ